MAIVRLRHAPYDVPAGGIALRSDAAHAAQATHRSGRGYCTSSLDWAALPGTWLRQPSAGRENRLDLVHGLTDRVWRCSWAGGCPASQGLDEREPSACGTRWTRGARHHA